MDQETKLIKMENILKLMAKNMADYRDAIDVASEVEYDPSSEHYWQTLYQETELITEGLMDLGYLQ